MVVDDDAQVRQMWSDLLQTQGFETSAAATGEEAKRLAEGTAFDLVLLDISLADENGLDLLPQLRKASPGTRVLVLTGLGYDQGLLSEALQQGADGYVTKDLPMEDLLNAVNRTLGL